MRYKTNIILLLLLYTFCYCTVKDNKNLEFQENSNDILVTQVEKNLELINRNIQSVINIYNQALDDATNGVSSKDIIHRYESGAAKHFQRISELTDEVTQLYIERDMSQQEYDDFVYRLNVKKVQSKVQELKSFGIKFDLNQDGIR